MSKALKKFWMILALLIVLMAVLSSVFRSLTPWAKEYKAEIEHHLSLLVGQPVTIQTMETGWYWFQPVLKLNHVSLGDASKNVFHLNKLLVGINLFKSLWNWQIQPGVLFIEDMRLNLREKKDHWTIDGVTTETIDSSDMTPEKSKQILTWLSQQEHLIIKHVSAYFYFSDGGLIPVQGLNISVANSGGYYKIKGNAALEQTNSTHFQLLGQGYFDPNRFEDIEGQFYFSAKNIVPAQWQSLFPKATEHLEGGKGNVALWVDIHHGSVSSVQAQVQFKRLAWRLLNNQHSQLIQSFFANLSWKPDNVGWQLHADRIQLRVGGLSWPENQLLIKYNKVQQSYQLFVKSIIVESLLSKAINWPEGMKKLIKLKPKGVLRDTQILMTKNVNLSSIPPIYASSTQPKPKDNGYYASYDINYVLTRFEHLGWNAQKNIPAVTNLSGLLNWQPEEGHFELDSENTGIKVKGYPQQKFGLLNGVFDWKELSDGLRVSVDRFIVSQPEITLSAQGVVDQVSMHSLGHIHLSAEFSGKNWQQWVPYLPQKYMKPKLYSWLKNEVKRIDEASGTVKINGLAKDFPFDNHNGQFLLESHASGGEISINPKWKIIKGLEGYIKLKNRDLNIDIVNADFQGVPVKQMNLRIDDIGKNKENLLINGTVHGAVQKMMDYVLASPLKKKLSRLTVLSIKGLALLNLRVQIPLYPENNEVLAEGELTFKNNRLVVNHDLAKLEVEDLNGELKFSEAGVIGSTLFANVLGQPFTIKIQSLQLPKPATEIAIEGKCTLDSLKDQFKLPLLSLFDGSFVVKALLKLTDNVSEADSISLNSSLEGLSIHLPQPLGKKAQTKVPLQINLDLDPQQSIQLKVAYNGIKVKAKMRPNKDWSFNLQQKNISADLSYHLLNNELSGHVHHLHLAQINELNVDTMDSSMHLQPKQIPNLNLRIDNLSVGRIRIGDVTLKSKSSAEKWVMNYCRIDSPVYQLDAQGEWTQKDKLNRTKLDVKLNITHLAKTLALWDVTPVVDAKKGYMEFHGAWNNRAYQFSMASLNGTMYLQLKNGRITHLSPETEEKLGLGKLLSVLSLQTIPRRLQLDFSDLSHQGYSFDLFQGNFILNKGIMNTQDSYLDGPVAYAAMKGDLDLVRHIYDLNLKISPHITASLPVVATIAGGPVAGVAAWVANKIINQGMQKIAAYSYKISGPWNQPVVQQLSIVKKREDS